MTAMTADETRLLVLFGEMRGDLKSLLQAQEELNARLTVSEAEMHDRLSRLSNRVRTLEAVRLRVIGFGTAMGAFAVLLGHKLGPLANAISKQFGG